MTKSLIPTESYQNPVICGLSNEFLLKGFCLPNVLALELWWVNLHKL